MNRAIGSAKNPIKQKRPNLVEEAEDTGFENFSNEAIIESRLKRLRKAGRGRIIIIIVIIIIITEGG